MQFLSITKALYPQIAQIYQEGLDTGIASFETSVPSWDEWDKACHSFARIAVVDVGTVFGWGGFEANF